MTNKSVLAKHSGIAKKCAFFFRSVWNVYFMSVLMMLKLLYIEISLY